MATRSIVRIIPSKASEQKDCSDVASRYIISITTGMASPQAWEENWSISCGPQ